MERFGKNEMETVARLEKYESVTTVEMNIRDLVSEQFWVINGRKKLACRIAFDKETCTLRLIDSEDCSLDAPEVKIFNKIMLVVTDGEHRLEAYFLGMARPDKGKMVLAGDTSAEELVETEYVARGQMIYLEEGTEVEFKGIIGGYGVEINGYGAKAEAYVMIAGQENGEEVRLIARDELARKFMAHKGERRISGTGRAIGRGWTGGLNLVEIKTIEFRA
jgi:hypothetical protein